MSTSVNIKVNAPVVSTTFGVAKMFTFQVVDASNNPVDMSTADMFEALILPTNGWGGWAPTQPNPAHITGDSLGNMTFDLDSTDFSHIPPGNYRLLCLGRIGGSGGGHQQQTIGEGTVAIRPSS